MPNADRIKGKLKEKAGQLTGNHRLRAEGKVDQATGAVKDTAEKVATKVKQAVDDATDGRTKRP